MRFVMDLYEKSRVKYLNRIYNGMIGPGSDIWGIPDEEELISDYPLIRYFSGIIFPEKLEESPDDGLVDIDDNNEANLETELPNSDSDPENFKTSVRDKDVDTEAKLSSNIFHPNSMGLTVALDKEATHCDVEVCFGLYYEPKNEEIRIKISKEGFESFFADDIKSPLEFSAKLKYENGFMSLTKPLEGKKTSPDRKHGEYGQFDRFKSQNRDSLCFKSGYIFYLEKLVSRVWKRLPYKNKFSVAIKDHDGTLSVSDERVKGISVKYYVRIYEYNNTNYLRFQLFNTNQQNRKKFSNKNEKLNKICLFQPQISICSPFLKEYSQETYSNDDEQKIINYIYQDVKNYGIGHNCSVIWDRATNVIKTTFMPISNMPVVSHADNNDLMSIKEMSVWGNNKRLVLDNLSDFANRYSEWITNQEQKCSNHDDLDVANAIIHKQKAILQRMIKGISFLENEDVFRAFQIANTAMYIQRVLSTDTNYSYIEKEISEVNNDYPYSDINNFINHSCSDKYRSFQLAFLLISIEGVVNPFSSARQDYVDLIWFPTGGGKTEAYLAVTAFTIAYRRIVNTTYYGGTTVLMRYTLRLLTAQQFERASRLIVALEYLRMQTGFEDLREETISIGMWVGSAATPNTLKEAFDSIDNIEHECNKQNGSPKDKNHFQISCCPWCGTKLITKTKDTWLYGFEKNRKDITIKCTNPGCFYNKCLPVNVVDELIYQKPPTLLFGTVDKFAQLAHKENTFELFKNNSNRNLPPELIIQDELHLLNGPLGSIVGIYESVIDLLCTTDGGVKPKIIASTATTRNTENQIQKLYSGRSVMIFPANGINYQDNFFYKTEYQNSTNRQYIGLMPTGKTSTDTQLNLLAHLLVARLEIFLDDQTKACLDNYWTVVSYYNNKKELGKIANKIGDEIRNFTATLQHRLLLNKDNQNNLSFNFNRLSNETRELTGRVDNKNIKAVLSEIESKINILDLDRNFNKISLVLATNMISVGIDIERLNVMLINGMPKNTAEYIQASSRIGRKHKGLAILLLDPYKTREKSYFEHFSDFHQAYYKFVEPLTVTPFTEQIIDKMLTTLSISFIRNYIANMAEDSQAKYFEKTHLDILINYLLALTDSNIAKYMTAKFNALAADWVSKIARNPNLRYKDIIKKPLEDSLWQVMNSLRDVDTSTYIEYKSDY